MALLVTGGTLDLMSFIGVIMLMSLIAKRHPAARLRPILMTTFALIAGMLPVAMSRGEDDGFYRPMAVAIIGGTIV